MVLGLHLATAHVRPGLEGVNPGAYVQCDAVRVGAYRNSIGRNTVYAGGVVEVGPWNVLIGAATGYGPALRPVLVPSIAIGGGFSVSVLLPSGERKRGGLHLSYSVAL